jgi:hypothetical protein
MGDPFIGARRQDIFQICRQSGTEHDSMIASGSGLSTIQFMVFAFGVVLVSVLLVLLHILYTSRTAPSHANGGRECA